MVSSGLLGQLARAIITMHAFVNRDMTKTDLVKKMYSFKFYLWY